MSNGIENIARYVGIYDAAEDFTNLQYRVVALNSLNERPMWQLPNSLSGIGVIQNSPRAHGEAKVAVSGIVPVMVSGTAGTIAINSRVDTLADGTVVEAPGARSIGIAVEELKAGAIGSIYVMPTPSSTPVDHGTIDHNQLLNYVPDQHIDWTNTTENFSTTGNVETDAIDTGQGLVECYAMNQPVQTTDSPIFAGATIGGVDVGTMLGNVIFVDDVSKFPAPVADVITLADYTTYKIASTTELVVGQSAGVDIGVNRIVTGKQSCIGSDCLGSALLLSSTTGVMITANHNFFGTNVSFRCPNASKFLEFEGAGVWGCFFDTCIFAGIQNLGTINNAGGGISFRQGSCLNGIGLTDATTGFQITGTANILTIFEMANFDFRPSAALTLFDTTDATTQIGFVQIEGNRVTTPTGATFFDTKVNNGSLQTGGSGNVRDNQFSGGGTDFNGIVNADLQWIVDNNRGTVSAFAGQGYINGSATTTIPLVIDTPIPVDFGGAFIADIEERFEITNEGRFIWKGLMCREFYADITIRAEVAGGTDRFYHFFIAKNGVPITSSITEVSYDGSKPGSSSVSSVVNLDTDDYIELWVEQYAPAGLQPITVSTVSVTIKA